MRHNPSDLSWDRYPELRLLAWSDETVVLPIQYSADGKANALWTYRKQTAWLHDPDSIERELERFMDGKDFESLDTVYIYGIGLGWYYYALRPWLQANSARRLVFLEDNLAVLWTCLHTKLGEAVFADAQAKVRFLPSTASDAVIEECVLEYPSNRVEVYALEVYGKRRSKTFASIRLKILRRGGLAYSYLMEGCHSHILNQHVLTNVAHISDAFFANGLKERFHDVPAVICGAGPTLAQHQKVLSALEHRALILAGGSAVAALGHMGVSPHLVLAIDPNPEERIRFEASSIQEVPFIYGHRLEPTVFSTCNAPHGYVSSHTGGPAEEWLEKQLGIHSDSVGAALGPEALSITTLGAALAVEMGCNPIMYVGVDLAYVQGKRYAEGVVQENCMHTLKDYVESMEKLVVRKNSQKQRIPTRIKWVMEAETLGSFAQQHPKRKFFNSSRQGLPMPGIPIQVLADWVDVHCTREWDLRGKIHALTQGLRMPQDIARTLQSSLGVLRSSLQSMQLITIEMLAEIERWEQEKASVPSGLMTALEMDFVQEEGFACLFSVVDTAWECLLRREQVESDTPYRRWKRKWEEYRENIACYLAQLHT